MVESRNHLFAAVAAEARGVLLEVEAAGPPKLAARLREFLAALPPSIEPRLAVRYLREIDEARRFLEARAQAQRIRELSASRAAERAERRKLTARIHQAVRYAVKTGRLLRPDACSVCGAPCRPHGHHDDYSKPLSVVWLCARCHRAYHAAERAGAA